MILATVPKIKGMSKLFDILAMIMMMMAVMSLRAKLCLWRLNSLFLHLSQLGQLGSKNFAFLYSFPKNLRNQTRLHSIG